LGDPTRLRIFEVLQESPMTAKQLAGALGLVTNRLYYHLRILLAAGVIAPAGTQVNGRFAEQMFSAPATQFDRELVSGADREDRAAFFSAMFKATADEVHDATLGQAKGRDLRLTRGYVRTTRAAADELWRTIEQATTKARLRAGDPDAENYRLVVALYEPVGVSDSSGDDA